MADGLAAEFPFVEELPKREKSRLQKLWDHFTEVKAITAQKGLLVPVRFAANLVGVSQQRVDQLCDNGSLERVYVDGHPFVTENSLIEWAKSERKAGRPPKLPQNNTDAWQVAKTYAKSVVKSSKK